jgi:hypothetical protein
MQLLNDHQCEAVSGGGYSLVLPNIGLGIITPINIGTAVGILEGSAMVGQGNTANINTDFIKLLGGSNWFGMP